MYKLVVLGHAPNDRAMPTQWACQFGKNSVEGGPTNHVYGLV